MKGRLEHQRACVWISTMLGAAGSPYLSNNPEDVRGLSRHDDQPSTHTISLAAVEFGFHESADILLMHGHRPVQG